MSFPPYPEKFNTYYNTGYKQFWGAGFPYIKDDFVGGYSGLEYPSDDDEKVRQKPVMDLQNIAGRGRGTGRPKKKGKGFLSDMLGTIGSTLGAIGKPIFENVPALKPYAGLLGENSLYGLASQGLKHIGLGKKKRGGRKMLPEDHPMYEPDVRILPYKHSLSDKSPPHDIPRPRIRKRRNTEEIENKMMEGEGADPELLRAVHKYRKENKVSLADAWEKVKKEMKFVKKEKKPKKEKKSKKEKKAKNINKSGSKITQKDAMIYKHKMGVSLQQAWDDLRAGHDA